MKRFAFPFSLLTALLYIAGSLWVALSQMGEVDRLERRLNTVCQYRKAIDQYDEALFASATRAWRFRAERNDADRLLSLKRLESARAALDRLRSADQQVKFGLDVRLEAKDGQAGLQAVETIAEKDGRAEQSMIEQASKDLQAIRAKSRQVVDEIDKRISQWQLELSSQRDFSRSMLVYGQIFMLGLIGLIYVSRGGERSLRSSSERDQRRFAMMLSEVPEPIYVEVEEGRVIFWNAGAEKLYGWPASQMLGKVADEILVGGSAQTHPSQHAEEYQKAPLWKGELRCTTATGKVLNVERRRTKISDEGQPIGTVVIDLDLGERKRVQLVDRRRQRLESLGTLASGIAHDLNNLLTPILMSSKMLARDGAKVNREGLVDTIHQAASRGSGLIEQLLLFARGGDGEHLPVDVSTVLEDTGKILQRTLKTNVDLELRIPETLPMVLGDETEISQVVMNLAINARDSMIDGGKLTVSAEEVEFQKDRMFAFTQLPAGRYVRVSVADTGVGIPPEQRDRIFEPFFSTKERGQGTGLGLSTSLGIIKSHAGAVEVASAVGQGTTISFLLPIAETKT